MRRPSTQRGLTLMEVMLSMAVVLVGMLALFRVLSVASRGSQQSQRFSQALARGQQVIEAMRMTPPSVLDCLARNPATSWSLCEAQCRLWYNSTYGTNPSPESCVFSSLSAMGLQADGTRQSYAVIYDNTSFIPGSSWVMTNAQWKLVYDVQVVVGFNEDNNIDNPLPQASSCGGAIHCVTLRTSIYREGTQ
jgi:prepilin-type N-terminal cleavage/methylation domain-containing protein